MMGRARHAHDLFGEVVCFLLVKVAGLVERQTCVLGRRRMGIEELLKGAVADGAVQVKDRVGGVGVL